MCVLLSLGSGRSSVARAARPSPAPLLASCAFRAETAALRHARDSVPDDFYGVRVSCCFINFTGVKYLKTEFSSISSEGEISILRLPGTRKKKVVGMAVFYFQINVFLTSSFKCFLMPFNPDLDCIWSPQGCHAKVITDTANVPSVQSKVSGLQGFLCLGCTFSFGLKQMFLV